MAPVNILEDPPINLPIIWPPGFLLYFRPAPIYITGLLTGYYIACGALYFSYINNCFKAYYKKGNIILPLIRKPSLYLSYLFISNNLLYRAFRVNIRVYNYTFAFILVKYKKDI
ncbi:uncharacterized protein K444DRAFT_706436 [Hyaloscypha bicolor E]|uniref:Uncharacterized protein n=1 Tax=Hyaloscypha bicolor E TaxID=1095630 RepID=A0A2J6SNN6_9HELO|nr:uncharacterized protein K444DRAFT_706436 [Hyaloscypha bicolor E]PMD52379.1 hypothetical protein K444DRAFT_706436 [Hyaloscypha bicolor E]